MSTEINKQSPESFAAAMNYEETELTLGLPGESRGTVSRTKRALTTSTVNCESQNKKQKKSDSLENERAQVVGWPPVKEHRKNITMTTISRRSKYVKVAVDGAPFLRKVDIESYKSYEELFSGLEELFGCFKVCSVLDEKKPMDCVNGVEYVPTYEDKDGDWMLLGDVPWNMFAQSCKRLRLMTRSDAIGLGSRTSPNFSSSSC